MMVPKVLCIGGPLDGEYSYSAVAPTVPVNAENPTGAYITYAERSVVLPTGEYSRVFAPDEMTDRLLNKALKKHFR
jgi:hypothetical protein